MVATRSYFIPGWGYINEVKGNAYFTPGWGYINETVSTVTTSVDKWIPSFPDKLNLKFKTNKEYTTINLGVFNAETVNLDKWLSNYPDHQTRFIQGQSHSGFKTVDIGVFTKETIFVDKWLPTFTPKAQQIIFRNTGSSYFLYTPAVIPPTPGLQTYFHKKRGQPGTIIRGAGPQGGNTLLPS